MRTLYPFFTAPPALKQFRSQVQECLECDGLCRRKGNAVGHHITITEGFSVDSEKAAHVMAAFDKLFRSQSVKAMRVGIGRMDSFRQRTIHLPLESEGLRLAICSILDMLERFGIPRNSRDGADPHFTLVTDLTEDTFGAAWAYISSRLRQPVGVVVLDRLCVYEKTPEGRWEERRAYRLN